MVNCLKIRSDGRVLDEVVSRITFPRVMVKASSRELKESEAFE